MPTRWRPKSRAAGIVAIAAGLLVGTPCYAHSQTGPPTTTSVSNAVRVGQAVHVTTVDGSLRKGVVFSLSASMLELWSDDHKVVLSFWDISKVEVEFRDPVGNGIRNGVLTGAASGAVVGLFLAEADCGRTSFFNACSPDGFARAAAVMAFLGTGVGAVMGWVVDASIDARRVVYRAAPSMSVRAIPLVSPRGAGVGVVVRW